MADALQDENYARRWNALTAVLAAGLALLAYVWNLPPGVTGEDSGELIAAAYTLGIPHPPGYPIWCMLAHLFTWLPGESVAWKVNFSSAVFGAATAGVVAWLLLTLGAKRSQAFCFSLLLAFSHEFWKQSLIAEVYTLNALFIALCVLWLARWHSTRNKRYLWIFAVTYGLSLGNHNTMQLLAPVFGGFILLCDRGAPHRLPRYLGIGAVILLIGFALQLYLPIRSLANPPVDWGNPETLQGWWDHVTRAQYSFMLDQYPRSFARSAWQIATMLGFLVSQWPPPVNVIVLAYVIVGLLRAEHRALKWLMLAIFVVTIAGFALIQNFNHDLEWLWVMRVFLLPALLALVVLACAGVPDCKPWLPYTDRYLSFVMVVLALIVVWNVASRRGDDTVPRYIHEIARELPENAIFVPDADHVSFPFLYEQVVEGRYPDVVLARKYGYLDTTALSAFVPDLVSRYGTRPPRRLEPEILAEVHKATDRPLVFTQRSAGLLRADVRQQGLTWTTGTVENVQTAREMFKEILNWLPPPRTVRDYTAKLIAAERLMAVAEAYFSAGDKGMAEGSLHWARVFYGDDANLLTNIGVLCARHGAYDLARSYWEDALNLDETFQPAINNLKKLDEKTRGEE